MNSLQIIGNISTNLDLRVTPSGKSVVTFNVAVSNPYNRDKTSFLPVEIWGKIGELTAEYCKKGSKIGITGHIEVDQWEKDGERKSKTKIIAGNVEFLTPKSDGNTGNNQSSYGNNSGNSGNKGNTSNYNSNSNSSRSNDFNDPFANDGTPIDISDDDLPF